MKKHVDVEHNGLIHTYEIAQVVDRSWAKQKKKKKHIKVSN
jgi:hypothetical protein